MPDDRRTPHARRAMLLCGAAIFATAAGIAASPCDAPATDALFAYAHFTLNAPAQAQALPAVRVHRAAFRDRAAMLLIDCGNGCWCAFNPRTAGIDLLWRGEVQWRGKVFDFSQQTSRESGEVLVNRMGPLVTAPETILAPGQTLTMRCPPAEADAQYQRLFVAFEEQERVPVSVSVLEADGKERLQFESCTNVSGDREWQWNFKQFEGTPLPASIQWKSQGTKPKPLRAMRLEGEQIAWSADGHPLQVQWMGYELAHGRATLRFRVSDARGISAVVTLGVEPGSTAAGGVRLTTSGVPQGVDWHCAVAPLRGSAEITAPERPASAATTIDAAPRSATAPPTAAAAPPARSAPIAPPVAPSAAAATSAAPAPPGAPVTPATPAPTEPVPAPPAQTAPGLTLWAWRLEGQLPRRPIVDEGQTPNLYMVIPGLHALRDPLHAADGPMADHFVGEAHGWLDVPVQGRYHFRLVGDDGATLILDGVPLIDTERLPGFVGEAAVDLTAGLHALRLPFYEDEGKFLLDLQWMPPGAQAYADIPHDALHTDAGQTPATSPGTKRWRFAQNKRRPGDGVPLVGPHPAFRLEKVRSPDFRPQVGALCFLPDGRLALAEWHRDGKIWILSNLQSRANSADSDAAKTDGASWVPTLFAQGLGEPLGLAWVDGALIVTQRGEITRLRDTDGDGVADQYECVGSGWPQSANYHEFTFNLVPWHDRLWFTTSVPLRSGLTNYMPGSQGDFSTPDGPGSLWSIARTGGDLRREARGLRTPNGMNRGVDGELFVLDNQGSWKPASRMDHCRSGTFYGHQERRAGHEPADPPVVWFPHGEIGNSPSEPVLVADGPHRGQMYVGDVTYGGVTRVFVERITGADGTPRYQGAVFPMSQGIEAGVNRLAWGPADGALYLGGVGSNGNWNHQGHTFGLERLTPRWTHAQDPDAVRGAAFEILRMKSQPDGFLLTLSAPADRAALEDPAHYEVQSWRYEPTEAYGGPKVGVRAHPVTRASASPDGRQVHLEIAALSPGTVVGLRLRDLNASDGAPPWSTTAWYTLNAIAPNATGFERFIGSPARPAEAMVLLDASTPQTGSWRMAKDGTACAWPLHADGSLEVMTPAQGIGTNDIVSDRHYEDLFLHMEWLSPPGGDVTDGQKNGNSGVKLAGRYEVQIMNTPPNPAPPKFNEAGSIYRQRAADCNASTGAGTWQSYDIWFTAPRWEKDAQGKDRKRANARMTVLWNGVLVHNDAEIKDKTGMSGAEVPGLAPILLQSHPSAAEGPVRFRNIWTAEGEAMPPRPARTN